MDLSTQHTLCPSALTVYMGCNNPTTDLILRKTICRLRCLHELLIEYSIHIPVYMVYSIVCQLTQLEVPLLRKKTRLHEQATLVESLKAENSHLQQCLETAHATKECLQKLRGAGFTSLCGRREAED